MPKYIDDLIDDEAKASMDVLNRGKIKRDRYNGVIQFVENLIDLYEKAINELTPSVDKYDDYDEKSQANIDFFKIIDSIDKEIPNDKIWDIYETEGYGAFTDYAGDLEYIARNAQDNHYIIMWDNFIHNAKLIQEELTFYLKELKDKIG